MNYQYKYQKYKQKYNEMSGGFFRIGEDTKNKPQLQFRFYTEDGKPYKEVDKVYYRQDSGKQQVDLDKGKIIKAIQETTKFPLIVKLVPKKEDTEHTEMGIEVIKYTKDTKDTKDTKNTYVFFYGKIDAGGKIMNKKQLYRSTQQEDKETIAKAKAKATAEAEAKATAEATAKATAEATAKATAEAEAKATAEAEAEAEATAKAEAEEEKKIKKN